MASLVLYYSVSVSIQYNGIGLCNNLAGGRSVGAFGVDSISVDLRLYI